VKHLKVVQIANDGFPTPEWASTALREAGIEFLAADCWNKADLAQHARDADIVWIFGGRRVLLGDNLSALERCGAIVRTGSGTDNVDIATATAMGIIVANTPQAPVDSVADQAISLLFSLVRQVTRHDRLIRSGRWDPLAVPLGRRFRNATLGLIGFGRIAQRVVRKLSGFEMRFVAYTRPPAPDVLDAHGVTSVSLDELLQTADYVSVHCPLTPETRHLIGERELRLMKRDALLINTARGPVVDEAALIRALNQGWIAGAGLDVLEKEPPEPSNPLLRMENVILTPHLGGNSDRFPQDFFEASVEAILDLAAGRHPQFVVNPGVQPRWGAMLPSRPK
jgi:D-3-phosphoglycerate dehydrogenase